jgi:hypothetical protein
MILDSGLENASNDNPGLIAKQPWSWTEGTEIQIEMETDHDRKERLKDSGATCSVASNSGLALSSRD